MCDPAEVFYLYSGDADDPAASLMRHLSSEHGVRSFSLFSYSFDGRSFNLNNLRGREKFCLRDSGIVDSVPFHRVNFCATLGAIHI